jgi:hypothetical protein
MSLARPVMIVGERERVVLISPNQKFDIKIFLGIL